MRPTICRNLTSASTSAALSRHRIHQLLSPPHQLLLSDAGLRRAPKIHSHPAQPPTSASRLSKRRNHPTDRPVGRVRRLTLLRYSATATTVLTLSAIRRVARACRHSLTINLAGKIRLLCGKQESYPCPVSPGLLLNVENHHYLRRNVTSIGTIVETGLPSGPLAGLNCHFLTVSMAFCSSP
jgi:hypothetical protein